ncbi:hypothetical protein GXW83_08160 [Streptacidiphilus sp. PB12-B1b]|uniref:hypothetical protein n=1 Tax=Streptacidiphilus sp. PB12-B1b TaxID=2705012 RepID=UPI0015FE7275|nr:hypothetical protein [Streptacidiphilus sp. PB12-B1b]QMU75717.1 hypothetical protein GXW83_08160 [Streptacidiphilus sp. PB12-B1b]
MHFELAPPAGVGPLQIGMTRQAANHALESLREPAEISASDRVGQHIFRPSGLMISIECTRDLLEAVELGRPSQPSDVVLFRGIDVFGLPARDVVSRMAEITTIVAAEDDAASFIAPDLLLSFWRPFQGDDDPEDEQGCFSNSVLLARPGYYDGPSRP